MRPKRFRDGGSRAFFCIQLLHDMRSFCLQVHSLRLALEDSQALLGQLKNKLDELTTAEQAAQQEAAAVTRTLAAVLQQVPGLPLAEPQGTCVQQAGSVPGATNCLPHTASQQPGSSQHAAGSQQVHSSGSLDRQVGSALTTLLQRISALEQQLASQQECAAADKHTVGVQCDPPATASTAVQAAPSATANSVASCTQTDTDGAQASGSPVETGTAEAEYGRPDAQQQQVAELTAQLAAARLAEVAVKADAETRLLEAERKVKFTSQEQKC